MSTRRVLRLTTALWASVVLASAAVAAQDTTTDARINRLAALGRFWAAIKYFHPAIDDAHPEQWDRAVLAVIPQVLAADSAEDFATALRSMIAPLGDSVTRVEAADAPKSSALTWGFAKAERRGSILIVTSGPIAGDALETGAKVASQMKDVTSVIFDLRPGAVHPWLFSLQALPLSREPVPFPAHRFRMHFGNVTPRGAEDTAYFSGVVTRSAPAVRPAVTAIEVPSVFLVRESSQLPLLAIALQAARRAHIVAEAPIDDRHIARHAFARHHQLPLADGWTGHVRTSEMLHADGTVGLVADRVVKGDGLDVARSAAEGRVPYASRPPAGAAYRVKLPEAAYPDDPFPSASLRVFAAFRFYAVFEWLYPYKDLIGRDMNDLMREALPKLLDAQNAQRYHLAVAEMVAQIGDSHAMADSQILTDLWGRAMPPIVVRPIEGMPVVVGLTNPAAERAGLGVGDVVETVDGGRADERLTYLSRFISASSPGALHRDAVNRLLRGPDSSMARIVVRKPDGRRHEVLLERRNVFTPLSVAPPVGATVRLLSNDVGYIDLRKLMPHEVEAAFATVADTSGLIFDMRGYPNGTRHLVAERLVSRGHVNGGTVTFPVALEPGTRTETRFSVTTPVVGSERPYRGKTVMLIDDRAQSQSEATALILKTAAATVLIGTPTAGALGEGSNFSVPGGLGIGLTGTSVTFPDGTPVQRVGVQPDLHVAPTVAGIMSGRDEVLDRALEFLRRGR